MLIELLLKFQIIYQYIQKNQFLSYAIHIEIAIQQLKRKDIVIDVEESQHESSKPDQTHSKVDTQDNSHIMMFLTLGMMALSVGSYCIYQKVKKND